VPGWDFTIGRYTVVPNPFWGGAAFPLVVFAILFAWPALERRVTGDRGVHNLLDRPRDVPWRTAIGAALFAWVALVFLFGAADRVYASFGVSYTVLVWVFRVLVWVVPVAVLVVARRVCLALQAIEQHDRRVKASESV
jgi:ubiquinol-cytochrome c reductase cytochrome b subunit